LLSGISLSNLPEFNEYFNNKYHQSPDHVSLCADLKKNSFFLFCRKILSFDSSIHIQNSNLITMKTGTVKFFNETKGYGFIKEDETGKEIFVHATGLIDKVRQDDKVTYEESEGKKGLNAINVKKA
jgi:CspA family cold shock protein